jgi:hypothetical protein
MSPEFLMLERNFTVMVVLYVLYSVFMILNGNFYILICQETIRWIVDGWISVVFEAAIII